jgi:hypothetical protein
LGLVKNLGKVLFNEFLLPFEVSSVLLLSAMVGAVLLATKEKLKQPSDGKFNPYHASGAA